MFCKCVRFFFIPLFLRANRIYEKLESVGLHGIQVKMWVRVWTSGRVYWNVKMAWILQWSLRSLHCVRPTIFEDEYVCFIIIFWYRVYGNLFNRFYLVNLDYNHGKYARARPFCIMPYSWNDFDIIIFSALLIFFFCLFRIYFEMDRLLVNFWIVLAGNLCGCVARQFVNFQF